MAAAPGSGASQVLEGGGAGPGSGPCGGGGGERPCPPPPRPLGPPRLPHLGRDRRLVLGAGCRQRRVGGRPRAPAAGPGSGWWLSDGAGGAPGCGRRQAGSGHPRLRCFRARQLLCVTALFDSFLYVSEIHRSQLKTPRRASTLRDYMFVCGYVFTIYMTITCHLSVNEDLGFLFFKLRYTAHTVKFIL